MASDLISDLEAVHRVMAYLLGETSEDGEVYRQLADAEIGIRRARVILMKRANLMLRADALREALEGGGK